MCLEKLENGGSKPSFYLKYSDGTNAKAKHDFKFKTNHNTQQLRSNYTFKTRNYGNKKTTKRRNLIQNTEKRKKQKKTSVTNNTNTTTSDSNIKPPAYASYEITDQSQVDTYGEEKDWGFLNTYGNQQQIEKLKQYILALQTCCRCYWVNDKAFIVGEFDSQRDIINVSVTYVTIFFFYVLCFRHISDYFGYLWRLRKIAISIILCFSTQKHKNKTKKMHIGLWTLCHC